MRTHLARGGLGALRTAWTSWRAASALLAAAFVASCVPADEALPTGSAEFTIASRDADDFLREERFAEYTRSAGARTWDVRVDRVLLSFKTMTIGAVGVPDQCAYRGRGAQNNILFEAARGNVQTFNGIQPGECPDVGIVLGPPDAQTTLAPGTTVDDVAALLAGPAAHAIVEATATPGRSSGPNETYRVLFRFDTEQTSSTFGGCRDTRRGVRIEPGERQRATISFQAASLFRETISQGSQLRFEPFAEADENGNADGVVTMDELERVDLRVLRSRYGAVTYALPDGQLSGTLGDFVRAQLRFVFQYGAGGICTGNPPGVK